MFEGRSLTEPFSKQTNFDDFVNLLASLKGFFSVIHQTNDEVYLAVDHVRSIPIFYTLGREVYVSDDPHWIRESIDDASPERLTATEFLFTGYVTGEETLFPHIKQLQAAEAVAIRNFENPKKTSIRYVDFQAENIDEEQIGQLVEQSDEPLNAAFTRLIRFANGRTIVVPLSGGLDSRMILLMLKRIGYDRITTFSNGRRNNREARVSRTVASALGLPWHFVEYSNKLWRRWFNSKEWNEYTHYANGLSSTPYVQDWPAIMELRKNYAVPTGSVFVPGHAAWHVGFHPRFPAKRPVSGHGCDDDLTSLEVFEGFYELQTFRRLDPSIQDLLTRRIRTLLTASSTNATADAANFFDLFWWTEYAAKFTINSVRAYEFFDYAWWVPLWDMDLVRFWMKVPRAYRQERMFNRLCAQRIETIVTGRRPMEDTSPIKPYSGIGLLLRKAHLLSAALTVRSFADYYKHPYAWNSIIPKNEYYHMYRGIENINSYLATQTIKQFFPKSDVESMDTISVK